MNLKTVTIADLKPHPNNPNTHPPAQIEALAESLDEFTQVKNVVIWKGRILAGHALVTAAIKRGHLTLDAVDVSHWDEAKATAFMLADVRLPDMAFVDDSILVEALSAIDKPLDIPGFDEDFLKGLPGFEPEPPPEPGEPQVDKAEELRVKWGTEVGQVWALGEHRVACGDCTDRGVVDRVMGGEQAILLLTDPPYDINKAIWDKIDNYSGWFLSCIPPLLSPLLDNGSAYIFGWTEKIVTIFSDFPFANKRFLVWYYDNKNSPSQKSWGRSFELIFYVCKNDDPIFNKDEGRIPYKQSSLEREKYGLDSKFGGGKGHQYQLNPLGAQPRDVLFYPALAAGRGQVERVAHPTQKPLDLIITLMSVSSNETSIILDPFLGSGTTLIAAHQLNRRCYGIELDPGYVAVTLQRFHDLTDITPELIK